MKRYIIVFMALVCCSTSAFAWNKFGQQCIAAFAERNLTPAAKEQTTKILGGDLVSNAWWLQTITKEPAQKHTGAWHFITVTSDLKSITTSERDGVVQIERCAAILRNRAEHSDSTVIATLKTLIHLVGDMHNISHVRIESQPLSRKNFSIGVSNGFSGKKEVVTNTSWRKFWETSLINRRASFSPEHYALDLALAHADDKANFESGDPRHWAADMGRLCNPLYEWAGPNYYMTREFNNRLELLNDKCMARAGYRLAALLNDIFK